MCKRIIPFVLSLFFVLGLNAQTLRKVVFEPGRIQTDKAAPRVPCSDSDAGTIVFPSNMVMGNSDSPVDVGNTIFLCANDSINIRNGIDTIFNGDPDPSTRAGVGYAIYECAPTIDGPDLMTVLGDCLIDNPRTPERDTIISADFNNPYGGLTTFRNVENAAGESFPDIFNNGEPLQWWFAPITFDNLNNRGEPVYEGDPKGSCVSVRLDQVFSVVYLNPIEFVNVVYPFEADSSRARLNIKGGLPEFDDNATNYTINIVNVADNSVRGMMVNGTLDHRGFPEIQVPSPGDYRITLTDGRGCPLDTIMTFGDFELASDDIEVNIEAPPGATIGQEFCVDITTKNFENILGGTFFFCWDPTILDYQRVDNQVDGTWLFGETLTDEGSLIPNFLSQDFNLGSSYPDGTTLFSICFIPLQVGGTGSARVEFCMFDPRLDNPPPSNPNDIILEDGDFPLPIDPDNSGQDILITDPDALNVLQIDDQLKDACQGENNGSFSIQVLGGVAPYDIVLTDMDGNTRNVSINEQDGIGIVDQLSAGDYMYEVFDSGVGADRKFSGPKGPITIQETDLAVVPVEISIPTCRGDSDGEFTVNLRANSVPVDDLSDYTFIWTDAISGDTVSTDEVASNLSAGNYTVVVMNNNSCASFPTNAQVSDPPALNIGQPTITEAFCPDSDNGAIAIENFSGGIPPLSFTWDTDPTETGNTLTGLTPGLYSYVITDGNNCQGAETTVEVKSQVDLKIELSTVRTQLMSTCFGEDNAVISVSTDLSNLPAAVAASITQDFVFTWSDNAPVPDNLNRNSEIANLAPDTFSVALTNPDLPGCSVTEVFITREPDSLVIETIDITPLSSCLLEDGAAMPTVVGGSGNYQYTWNDNDGMLLENTEMVTGLGADTITLIVNDDMGCMDSKDTIISTPPPPEIVAVRGDTAIECASFTTDISIEANPGPTGAQIDRYSWSHNQALDSPNAANLGPDTILVSVIDTDGCAAVEQIIITAPPPIQTSALVIDTTCFESADGGVSLIAMGGPDGASYTYEWTAKGDPDVLSRTGELTDVESGNYDLTIMANNCPFDTTIAVANFPKIEINLFDPTPVRCFDLPASECNGSAQVTAEYEGTGGGSFLFTWVATGDFSSPTNSFSANNLCSGFQAIEATDGRCTSRDSIMIPSPAAIELAILDTFAARCFGEANGRAVIDAIGGDENGAYTFEWPDGSTLARRDDLAAGPYAITITDQNMCTGEAELSIGQPSELTVAIDLNPDRTHGVVCPGDADGSIAVIVEGGNAGTKNFDWTDNVSSVESAAGLTPQNYVIVVTDVEGCTDMVEYEVTEPDPILFTPSWLDIQCNGYDTQVSVSNVSGGNGNDYTFSIDGSPARPIEDPITEFGGPRVISVFDATGCQVDTLVDIPQPDPLMVDFAENIVEVDLGGEITLDLNVIPDASASIESIFWQVNGQPVDSTFLCSFNPCTNPTVNPLQNSVYSAFVTDTNGCFEEGRITVEVDKNRNVYIPNIFAPNNKGFDTNDRFEIFTGSGVRRIKFAQVFNRWGTVVADLGEPDASSVGIEIWDGRLRGETANQGVYIYI